MKISDVTFTSNNNSNNYNFIQCRDSNKLITIHYYFILFKQLFLKAIKRKTFGTYILNKNLLKVIINIF